jgi:DNA-binding transcriptional LysR family regulator
MFPELNIELLRTFVAIAESGSFTKAARAVFRSQAAVSMQVKRLEESIQQPLFIRDTRNLELSHTGDGTRSTGGKWADYDWRAG